jgi:hypothetical protein
MKENSPPTGFDRVNKRAQEAKIAALLLTVRGETAGLNLTFEDREGDQT